MNVEIMIKRMTLGNVYGPGNADKPAIVSRTNPLPDKPSDSQCTEGQPMGH